MFRLSDTLINMPAIRARMTTPLEALQLDLQERGLCYTPAALGPDDFTVYISRGTSKIWHRFEEPHILHADDQDRHITIELSDPHSIHKLYQFLGLEK